MTHVTPTRPVSAPVSDKVDAAPAAPQRVPVRRRWGRLRAHHVSTALIALPMVAVFLIFAWGPIMRGLVMSFQQTNFVTADTWVGWSNFAYVLDDPLLPVAVTNTIVYGLLCAVLGFPLPIFLAVAMSELRKRGSIYSALAYLPVVFPPVVSILMWKVFFDPSPTGLFNTALGWFGVEPQPWLNSPDTAMISLVFEATWAGAGTGIIIFIAALTSVNSDLYEAAELDGARIWRRIWHITLPQIRGIILVLLLLQVIGTAQVFSGPYLFTGGGPNNATMTVLLMIFNYAFVNGDYGAAAALSLLLALALAIIAAAYQFFMRRANR